jgi:nucleoside-diphosphate-sugar epimerase
MPRTALVVGGTGPTGPHIVDGLLDRGYEVAVLHRGTHEDDELSPAVEHIHADPHYLETFSEGIRGRNFDLVIATYGRVRVIAEELAGRCEQFVGVGGSPIYRGKLEPSSCVPWGMKLLATEDDETVDPDQDFSQAARFGAAMAATERTVWHLASEGAFHATWFRYPMIYGPRNPNPREWHVLKRLSDKRSLMIIPDGGLAITSRAAGRNAAHAILLAVDHMQIASGQTYNIADQLQHSLRQWIELIVDLAGGSLDLVSLPWELAYPAHSLFPFAGAGAPHDLLDATKIQRDLGYRDKISVPDALLETIDYYNRHPVDVTQHASFHDLFDYQREDILISTYRRMAESVSEEVSWPSREVVNHSYAHPHRPNLERDHRGR